MNSRRRFILALALALASLCPLSLSPSAKADDERKPNFIVILADDLGYGDFGCYGAKDIATPNVDRMAAEGLKLNDFYVTPVCSSTRASLMTGSYCSRVSIGGVLFERSGTGLNREELTIPELLKEHGYATGLVGKWHLGYRPELLPPHHGFDYWFGTVASNNTRFLLGDKAFAENCVYREGLTQESVKSLESTKCSLMRGAEVVEVPADQTQLTKQYTEEAIRFISEHKDEPFFLYLAHNMPHIPLYASEDFLGKSGRGLYGDVIQELDWGIGELFKALKEQGLDEHTFVILTSDNGPKISAGGSAGPLRGGKGSSLEGGVRVPCLMRWPGKIEGGRESNEPLAIFDILPTLVTLAGGQIPTDRVLDGKDIWPVVSGQEGATSPHEAYFYMKGISAAGVRVGDWKYIVAALPENERQDPEEKVELTKEEQKLPRAERKKLIKARRKADGNANDPIAALYHLTDDLGEQANAVSEHPDKVAEMKALLEAFNQDLRANKRPSEPAVGATK